VGVENLAGRQAAPGQSFGATLGQQIASHLGQERSRQMRKKFGAKLTRMARGSTLEVTFRHTSMSLGAFLQFGDRWFDILWRLLRD